MLQRGRGIDGLLRLSKSIFSPFLRSIRKTAVEAATSQTGQKAVKILKEQALSSSLNMAADAVRGQNLKESGVREVNKLRTQLGNMIESIGREKEEDGSSRKKKVSRGKVRFVPKSL